MFFMRNTILSKEILCVDVCSFWVYHPEIASHYEPGQFVMVRLDDKGERIPLTIVDTDPEKGTFRLVVQDVGYTSNRMCALKTGDVIPDILGPLGQGVKAPEGTRRALFVGGGLGAAPLYPKIKDLAGPDIFRSVILGARDAEHLILADEIEKLSDELILCTDDGSEGRKGFVTDAVRDKLEKGEKFDICVAIGPLVMMKAVTELNLEYGLKTLVSLNPIMVDGTGMCGGCRFEYDGQTRFACVHGPVFEGGKVNFRDLLIRNGQYAEAEAAASGRRTDKTEE